MLLEPTFHVALAIFMLSTPIYLTVRFVRWVPSACPLPAPLHCTSHLAAVQQCLCVVTLRIRNIPPVF